MSLEVINNGITEGSIVDLLDRQGRKEGTVKQWSVKNPVESWSYRELSDTSIRLTSLLQSKGIAQGDRVILWGPNSPHWVTAYFASLRASAIVVPFDINNTDTGFLDRIIETTKPRLIIAGADQKNMLPFNNSVPVLEMDHVDRIPGSNGSPKETESYPDDLAEIVFTSGTTGNPKGVMLTHRNILSNIEAVQDVITITPKHKLLSILPLSHMFETTGGLLVPIASGATIVYTDTLKPASLMQAIHDEQITCMAVVPQVLQLFKTGIEQEIKKQHRETLWNYSNRVSPYLPMSIRRILFSSLHKKMGGRFDFFVCGGAGLDPKLANAWENLGIKIIQGYGMTEAAPIVTCDSMTDRNHGYVGRPIPGVDVRITPDGEILVKGPNVMPGYWKNPAATAEVLKDGWYRTGDLGTLEGGRLRLHGRTLERIVLPNGLNVYPADVELVLKQQGIRDAIVFGRKNHKGEEVHAILLLEQPKDPKVLVQAANKYLAPHQQIRHWSVWPDSDFPRTHTLKPKRLEVIDRLKHGQT